MLVSNFLFIDFTLRIDWSLPEFASAACQYHFSHPHYVRFKTKQKVIYFQQKFQFVQSKKIRFQAKR